MDPDQSGIFGLAVRSPVVIHWTLVPLHRNISFRSFVASERSANDTLDAPKFTNSKVFGSHRSWGEQYGPGIMQDGEEF